MALLTAMFAVVAIVNLLVVVPRLGLESPAAPVMWPLLTLAFFAAEVWVVHFPFRRQSQTFSMSEIPLLFGLFLLGPEQLVLVHVIGAGLAIGIHRRRGVMKTAFNMALFAATSSTSWILLHALVEDLEGLGLASVVATFGVLVLSGLLQSMAVVLVIALTADPLLREDVAESALFTAISSCANGAIGLIVLLLLSDQRPWAAYLVLIPGLLMLSAYNAYSRQRQAAARADVVARAGRELGGAVGVDGVVARLLPSMRQHVRAERVEFTLWATPDADGCRAVCDDRGHRPLHVLDLSTPGEEALRHGLELAGPLLADTSGAVGALRDYARGRGWRDALAVPLSGAHGAFGAIVVANREGELDTFGGEDLELLSSLAATAASILERDRLGNSLDEVLTLQERYARLTTTDGATGLVNRQEFERRVQDALEGPVRGTSACLVLHLTGLGEVNAGHGAQVGDEVLRLTADRLRATVPSASVIGRVGGARFAVLLPDIDDVAAVHELATALGTGLQRPHEVEDAIIVLRCDVGLALDIGGTYQPRDFLVAAEQAARLARSSGASTYVTFGEELADGGRRRLAVDAALAPAVASGSGIGVAYQPVVDLRNGVIVSVEALARWDHDVLGAITPAEFLPAAERFGLLPDLGRWVIRRALEDAASWHEQGQEISVSINVAPSQLRDQGFLACLDEDLRRTAFPAAQLILDLDASAIAGMLDLRFSLDRLRLLGVKVALDGVGADGTSLRLADEIAFDELKLGRDLVGGRGATPAATHVLQSLVQMAHDARATVVAGGIEDEAELRRARRAGTDRVQGFLVARPMNARQVAELLVLGPRAMRNDQADVVHLDQRIGA